MNETLLSTGTSHSLRSLLMAVLLSVGGTAVSCSEPEPPVGLGIFFACGGGLGTLCQNTLAEDGEFFTVTITDEADNPESGILVQFTVDFSTTSPNESDDDTTLDPVECKTAGDGKCSTSATNPSPEDGDYVTVTATIVGQVPVTQASVFTRWVEE